MGIQEQNGVKNPQPLSMPNSHLCIDVRTSSANSIQLKEQGSSGDERALKVRKPYTITKQRERWTEEDHKKFLEALQLYGRAWRHIEEHIGTKTTVQIRSHAQKFFSKVARESASNSTGNAKPIEIPPPRPKRKPVHPYPRKMGHPTSNGNPIFGKSESSSSPIPSICEQENGSPTSVLSTIDGSDTMCSLRSNLPNSCTSPVASGNGSNEQETSVEEENRPPSGGTITAAPSTQDQYTMELDLICEGHCLPKKASLEEARVSSLKLFGRTVLVTDSHKPSSSVGNAMQCGKSVPSVDDEGQDGSSYMDLGAPPEPLQVPMHGDVLVYPGKGTRIPWCGGDIPMIYSIPSYGNSMNMAEGRFIAPPWWTSYQDLPFPFVHPQNLSSGQDFSQLHAEASVDRELQKECSWSGSSASSGESIEHFKDKDATSAVRPMPIKVSASSGQRSGLDSDQSARGFVPYKRCVLESEVRNHQSSSDEGEDQRLLQLCL